MPGRSGLFFPLQDSFATLQHLEMSVMEMISMEALKKLKEFAVQHLGNTVWSLANLAVVKTQLVEAISAEGLRRISSFEPTTSLDQHVWSFATLTKP